MAEVMPPNMLNDRPRTPAGLLSNAEKDRLIERGFLGLYRWYTARSQETRNWNAGPQLRLALLMNQNLPPELITVIQGFFAVEQYAPDFTSSLMNLVRRSPRPQPLSDALGQRRGKARRRLGKRRAVLRPAHPAWIEEYKERLKSRPGNCLSPTPSTTWFTPCFRSGPPSSTT